MNVRAGVEAWIAPDHHFMRGRFFAPRRSPCFWSFFFFHSLFPFYFLLSVTFLHWPLLIFLLFVFFLYSLSFTYFGGPFYLLWLFFLFCLYQLYCRCQHAFILAFVRFWGLDSLCTSENLIFYLCLRHSGDIIIAWRAEFRGQEADVQDGRRSEEPMCNWASVHLLVYVVEVQLVLWLCRPHVHVTVAWLCLYLA